MSIKEVFTIENWLTPLFIILIAGVSVLFNDNYQIFILVCVLGLYYYKKQLNVDEGLIFIIILWVVINFISIKIINHGQPYSLVTVFSRLMLLITVYFIVKLIGERFYDILNKHVFVLALISIPAYVVQITSPGIMQSLGSVFSIITKPDFALEGNWYSYLFTYSVWHPLRNCGFMWEPGAFAGIMVFMITYRFSVNDFKLDRYVLIYTICLITSLSTAGYLALAVLVFAFFLKHQKQNILLIPLFIGVVYFSIDFYESNEFLSGKINEYARLGTDSWSRGEDMSYRTSRLGYAIVVLKESLHWPFGHGVIDYSSFMIENYNRIYGPGALSNILHQWGWLGLIGVGVYIYKFYNRKLGSVISVLFTLALLIILFSNPFEFLMVIYSIVFYVMCFKEKAKYPYKKLCGEYS